MNAIRISKSQCFQFIYRFTKAVCVKSCKYLLWKCAASGWKPAADPDDKL